MQEESGDEIDIIQDVKDSKRLSHAVLRDPDMETTPSGLLGATQALAAGSSNMRTSNRSIKVKTSNRSGVRAPIEDPVMSDPEEV